MAFTVNVEPSGHEFQVEPGESLLDAALRAGLALPYGCRNGACRSCKGRVLEGAVRYPEGRPKALYDLDVTQGWSLFCKAVPESDLRVQIEELDAGDTIVVRTLMCRVVEKSDLCHDVVGLTLALQEGERLTFLGGQYVDIILRDGRRRAFSLASTPGEGHRLELHVRRVPGGTFSEYVANHLHERAILRIMGPLGSFYLRKALPNPVILMAGGTGFAPIKSILEDALGGGFDRPLKLYVGVRARRDLYMHHLASAWAAAHPNLSYTPVLSEPDEAHTWTGRTGFVHDAVLEDLGDLSDHVAYMSGPPVMVRAGRDAFVARGLDPANVHSDSFEYAHETGHDRHG